MTIQTEKTLEILPNPSPDRDYDVDIECPEFTCLCPRTGQPDFANILVNYIPGKHIFELKSFKIYLWSFRNEGHYHEKVVNLIRDDIIKFCHPKRLTVIGKFKIRGGITTTITTRFP